jgi:GNAT superfamily N-acetyltransferase
LQEGKLESEKPEDSRFRVDLVLSWQEEQIVELYRAGGWWREEMNSSKIKDLISGSFLFAVAISISTGMAIGMGRVISDGIADAYIQDLVVLDEWRHSGVGKMILARLLEECRSKDISWIGLIAEPGKEDFYRSQGFLPLPGHVPMLFSRNAGKC